MTFIQKVKIPYNAIKPVRERKHLPPVAGRTLKENIRHRRVVIHTNFTFLRFCYQRIFARRLSGNGDVGVSRNETGAPREPWEPFYASVPLA